MFKRVNGHLMIEDKLYSLGKKAVQVWIPAISTLYFTLSKLWGFPSPEQVIGTLAALATFLGISLHLSSTQYDASGAAYDGNVVISDTEEGTKMYSLELHDDPEEIENKDSVNFKVVPKAKK